jgi:hypothetical protein
LKTTDKIIGLGRLAKWHEKVNQSGFKLNPDLNHHLTQL